jgi:hypothetical protein
VDLRAVAAHRCSLLAGAALGSGLGCVVGSRLRACHGPVCQCHGRQGGHRRLPLLVGACWRVAAPRSAQGATARPLGGYALRWTRTLTKGLVGDATGARHSRHLFCLGSLSPAHCDPVWEWMARVRGRRGQWRVLIHRYERVAVGLRWMVHISWTSSGPS